MKDQNRSLTPQEVADILNIARTTVYEMVKRGELASYRIGRKLRFDLDDVENYRKAGKGCERSQCAPDLMKLSLPVPVNNERREHELIIAGQDIALDILTCHYANLNNGIFPLRTCFGNYNGLISLYRNEVDASGIHLFDGRNGDYNLSFVRTLLPGTPCVLVHLLKRRIGFYVRKGNPKNIRTWDDLGREDVIMINSPHGTGERVLLDQKLQSAGLQASGIKGYQRETWSSLISASIVGAGNADVAVGNEFFAPQIPEIEFLPLQWENYDLAIRTEDLSKNKICSLLDAVNSEDFVKALSSIRMYNLEDIGKILTAY